jgi:hypothetical protein
MDANIKQKWVEALRSGEYKQAQYGLKRQGGFCCLGVLCDLHDNTKWENDEDGYSFYQIGDEIQSTWLPESLEKELAIPSSELSNLVTMNDADNKTFAEIADYIEQKL